MLRCAVPHFLVVLLMLAATTNRAHGQPVPTGVRSQEPQPPEWIPALEKGANAVGPGLQQAYQGLANAGGQALRWLPQQQANQPPQPAPARAPTYLDFNLKMKDASLAKMVSDLGLKLPFPLEGKLSFQVKAAMPLDQPGVVKAYKVRGSAQVTHLVLAGIRLAEATAEVVYEEGTLSLSMLKGRFPAPFLTKTAGSFQGTAQLTLFPPGNLEAELKLEEIPFGTFAAQAPVLFFVGGNVSGQLQVRIPADRFRALETWQASGQLTSPNLSALGLRLQPTTAQFRLEKGLLNLTRLSTRLEDGPINGTASLRLSGSYPFQATAELDNWSLTTLKRLLPQWRPPFTLAGTVKASVALKGALAPFQIDASGTAQASNLKVERVAVNSLQFHWNAAPDRLHLKEVVARLYGGEVAGSATVPLQSAVKGAVNLQLRNLDVQTLASSWSLPISLTGRLDGGVQGSFAMERGQPWTATGKLALQSALLRVQNIPAEKVHGTVEFQKGAVDYRLEGKALGGDFELDGQLPAPAPTEKKPQQGHLRIEGAQLERLLAAYRLDRAIPLRGTLRLNVAFTQDAADGFPTGRGRVGVTNLRWQDAPLASQLQGDVLLSREQIRLQDVTGTVARGSFRARGAFDLRTRQRSWLVASLDNAEAAQLLAPWFQDQVQGLLQVRLRSTLGSEWQGSAEVELTRGKVLSAEVNQWRLPITFRHAPQQFRGQAEVYDTSAQVARGQATGRARLAWDPSLRLEGQVRFQRVDLQTFLRQVAGWSQLGSGQMSGRFDFTGQEVRSVADLSGTLEAAFNNAQALQLPVLRALSPFLGVGPSTLFQRGDLRARLDRGLWRIQRLALQGARVELFLDGTITLQGRLNLEVVARTGELGLPAGPLRLLGLRIPLAGPIPLGLLQEASTFLSNRVLYLRVTGTLQSPIIRLQPVAILTQEAVRYFLTRTVLPLP